MNRFNYLLQLFFQPPEENRDQNSTYFTFILPKITRLSEHVLVTFKQHAHLEIQRQHVHGSTCLYGLKITTIDKEGMEVLKTVLTRSLGSFVQFKLKFNYIDNVLLQMHRETYVKMLKKESFFIFFLLQYIISRCVLDTMQQLKLCQTFQLWYY